MSSNILNLENQGEVSDVQTEEVLTSPQKREGDRRKSEQRQMQRRTHERRSNWKGQEEFKERRKAVEDRRQNSRREGPIERRGNPEERRGWSTLHHSRHTDKYKFKMREINHPSEGGKGVVVTEGGPTTPPAKSKPEDQRPAYLKQLPPNRKWDDDQPGLLDVIKDFFKKK
jgi:hypothetical protein